MTEQNYDIPLHDIKPLLEVQEYSLYYLIALSAVTAFILFALIYLILKWFKSRNAFNIRKEHFELLNAVDLSDAKKAAYEITFYGNSFSDDSPRHSEMYKNLVERLESYKYKKSVKNIDSEVIGYIELYRGMIDV
ncbi:MAG: hypothetical protein U9Q40_08655 [Campylobacterota bacterium]|nr:hypothetical protein [Campylobacterota bacterium]